MRFAVVAVSFRHPDEGRTSSPTYLFAERWFLKRDEAVDTAKERTMRVIAIEGDAEPYRYRVLIKGPDLSHIPYFQMPIALKRPAHFIRVSTDQNHLRSSFRRDVLRPILDGEYGSWQLQTTRDRLRQDAFHCLWLGLEDEDRATAFVGDNPNYGLEASMVRLSSALSEQRKVIDDRVGQGDFDLSRLRSKERTKRARTFLDLHDKISRARARLEALNALKASIAEMESLVSLG